jgi:hypothetical protein
MVHYNKVELALGRLSLGHHVVSRASMLTRRKERRAKREEKIWKRGKARRLCLSIYLDVT